MQRSNSFYYWNKEQGPTLLLEQNLAAHISNNEQRLDKKKQGLKGSFSSYGSWETSSSGTNKVTRKSIRFQVIVWTIERPDVSLSQVNMKFRVTLFWNAHIDVLKKEKEIDFQTGSWRMHGRSKAIFCGGNTLEKGSSNEMLVDVPPLAILNANSFQAIGTPEVLLLREKDGLMRWSCLYKATLSQAEMTVTNFPHDTHYLRIQLGILQNRYAGAMWDRNVWDLNLATEDDSRGSTRTPYGLVVDRLKIPEFTMGSEGAEFSFVDLPRGFQAFTGTRDNKETCLHVSIRVKQQSTYYDINIIPLVTVITAVAITALLALDATNFFQRSLLMLNCAFVEVGLRMNIDNRLPRARYQIKLQKILNHFFYMPLFLVLESGCLHLLIKNNLLPTDLADTLDCAAIILTSCYVVFLNRVYYKRPKSSSRNKKNSSNRSSDVRLDPYVVMNV